MNLPVIACVAGGIGRRRKIRWGEFDFWRHVEQIEKELKNWREEGGGGTWPRNRIRLLLTWPPATQANLLRNFVSYRFPGWLLGPAAVYSLSNRWVVGPTWAGLSHTNRADSGRCNMSGSVTHSHRSHQFWEISGSALPSPLQGSLDQTPSCGGRVSHLAVLHSIFCATSCGISRGR